MRWGLLSCLGFPLIAAVVYQAARAVGIASRGIDAETIVQKFLIGFVVDLAMLVGLATVLSFPVILAALHLPSRVAWASELKPLSFLTLGIVVWQLPISAAASRLLDAPSMGRIFLVGVFSLLTPLLLRSVRAAPPVATTRRLDDASTRRRDDATTRRRT